MTASTETIGAWIDLVEERSAKLEPINEVETLKQHVLHACGDILNLALKKFPETPPFSREHIPQLIEEQYHQIMGTDQIDPDHVLFNNLFKLPHGKKLLVTQHKKPISKLAIMPATKTILEHLDWFQNNFDEVSVADNFKAGEVHFGQEVEKVEEIIKRWSEFDAVLLSTNTPEIESIYRSIIPQENLLHISDLVPILHYHPFLCRGIHRARRILTEIEQTKDPLVVLGKKLIATTEPIIAALESQGRNTFVISLFDKMENRNRSGWDQSCDISRNALVSIYELLYIIIHLKKGKLFIYYDFFHNVGWDTLNSIITYGYAATMLKLASRPVILGMYDILKPVCKHMSYQDHAFALYKVMLDLADAVVLTSKSDHIAEYLRHTLVKDRPVLSFYRYSVPSEKPLKRLSEQDGCIHIAAVSAFLGEVYEPNRIETRQSLISILQQKIHFHYFSDHTKVHAFKESLSNEDRTYFHIEPAIWDQKELVQKMSQYDAGWLVGDEATIFAKLITEVRDRNIRELFTLFVPNGVPTSSMTYGAAGLAVFISRQIKVMMDVYPPGCCIPLDMGEIDELAQICARLDWNRIHQIMEQEKHRFNAYAQIKTLNDFIDSVPSTKHIRTSHPSVTPSVLPSNSQLPGLDYHENTKNE